MTNAVIGNNGTKAETSAKSGVSLAGLQTVSGSTVRNRKGVTQRGAVAGHHLLSDELGSLFVDEAGSYFEV